MKVYQISEFVKNLSEIKSDLSGGRVTICIEHLIRLAVFQNSQNKNHWRTEVYASFHSIPKIKGNNKLMKPQDIFDCVWHSCGDMLDAYVECILKDEPNEIVTTSDLNEVTNKVLRYIRWLANKLGTKGVIDSQSVYNKLEELEL